MDQLNISLFGKFDVSHNGRSLPGFESRRVQELFAYILLQPRRPHARETLSSLLWDGNSSKQAKKYLRQALWQLQSALEGHTERPILLVDAEWVQLQPQAPLVVDTAVLEQTYAVTQGIAGREMNREQVEKIVDATAVYAGDLLDGWYHDWCLHHRERLQAIYLALLDKLMGYSEAYCQYESGIQHGTTILGFDRARERTHRRLMRLYYLAGHRTTALRQFDRCRHALHQELGVSPSQTTQALYEKIRSDQPLIPYPPEAIPPSPPQDRLTTLDSLKQLHSYLFSLQQQLQQEIQSAEQILQKN